MPFRRNIFHVCRTKKKGGIPPSTLIYIHFYLLLGAELINQVQRFHFLPYIGNQKIQVVLRNIQTRMP